MNTEQKFGLINQQFGIIYDAIKNTQADVNYLSANNPALDQLSDVNINSVVNGDTLVYNSTTSEWVNSATSAEVPLTFSTGLTRTVNTITNNLSTGVVGGQTAIGGTGITDILKLKGTTANGTSASPAIQAIVGNNGATTALTILNSGNVGIGTSSPAYTLDVNGSAKFTTIRDSANSVGTSGQVLSSTSSVLSWITPFALPTLTGLSGDAIVSDGSGNIKVSITGNNNYSSGATAFISRTTAIQSTAVGVESLKATTSGSSNVGVGFQALKDNLSGFDNVAVGTLALVNNTGNTNTSIGHHSLFHNTSGSNNSAIGTDAGKFIADDTSANSTGSNSVFLGANTKASANAQSNQVVIGHNAIGNGANSITLGNTLIAKTIIPYGNVGIGTTTPLNLLHLYGTDGNSYLRWTSNLATTGTRIGYNGTEFRIDQQENADVTIRTNHTERMRITNAGNVGIGTTSPTNILNVKGGLYPLKIEPTGSATDGVNLTLGYNGISFNTNGTYKTFAIENTLTADANALMNFNNGGSTRMTIANAGNVGIGTTTPNYKLHVEGSGTANEIVGWFNNQGTFSSSIAVRNSNKTAYLTNHQGLSTPNYTGQLASALALGVASGVSPIQFWNGSPHSAKMTILETGNVGIGTSSPAYPLDVNGSAKFTTIRDSANSVGTSGQVLSSTGTALAWVSPSGGTLGVCIITETKTAGTNSSVAFTAGTSTQPRQFNAKTTNGGLDISLNSATTFYISSAGTYLFEGNALLSVPEADTQTVFAKLFLNNNSEGMANAIIGDSFRYGPLNSNVIKDSNLPCFINGILTINSGKTFSLDHSVISQYFAPSGGKASNILSATEIYATLKITKIA